MIGCVSPRQRRRRCGPRHGPGDDGPRIRARLGVVPQQDTLDTELTVRENLLIYGRYFDLTRAEVRASGPTSCSSSSSSPSAPTTRSSRCRAA